MSQERLPSAVPELGLVLRLMQLAVDVRRQLRDRAYALPEPDPVLLSDLLPLLAGLLLDFATAQAQAALRVARGQPLLGAAASAGSSAPGSAPAASASAPAAAAGLLGPEPKDITEEPPLAFPDKGTRERCGRRAGPGGGARTGPSRGLRRPQGARGAGHTAACRAAHARAARAPPTPLSPPAAPSWPAGLPRVRTAVKSNEVARRLMEVRRRGKPGPARCGHTCSRPGTSALAPHLPTPQTFSLERLAVGDFVSATCVLALLAKTLEPGCLAAEAADFAAALAGARGRTGTDSMRRGASQAALP